MSDLTTSTAVDTFMQSASVAAARTSLGLPIANIGSTSFTSFNNIAINPHATIIYKGYFYVFDVALASACKINAIDFSDVIYSTATHPMAQICDGGDGFLYAVSNVTPVHIYRIDPVTLANTDMGNTTLGLGSRPSICSDGLGNLYVVASNGIQKWTTGGAQLASVTNTLLLLKGHCIVYAGGSVFVTSSAGGSVVLKLSSSTLTGSSIALSTPFIATDDMAFDSTYLYIFSESGDQGGIGAREPRMARVKQSDLSATYYHLDLPSYGGVFDGNRTVWILYGSDTTLSGGRMAAFDTVNATLTPYVTNLPGIPNEVAVVGGTSLIVTTWGVGGGKILTVVPQLDVRAVGLDGVQTRDWSAPFAVAEDIDTGNTTLYLQSSNLFQLLATVPGVITADFSFFPAAGVNSSTLFVLTIANYGVGGVTKTFDPAVFVDSNGVVVAPVTVPASGTAVFQFMFIGTDFGSTGPVILEVSRKILS
jgi:hypothetical protein